MAGAPVLALLKKQLQRSIASAPARYLLVSCRIASARRMNSSTVRTDGKSAAKLRATSRAWMARTMESDRRIDQATTPRRTALGETDHCGSATARGCDNQIVAVAVAVAVILVIVVVIVRDHGCPAGTCSLSLLLRPAQHRPGPGSERRRLRHRPRENPINCKTPCMAVGPATDDRIAACPKREQWPSGSKRTDTSACTARARLSKATSLASPLN
jgi:hypothetical protein